MFGIVIDDLLPSQRNLECIGMANHAKAHLFTKTLTRTCKSLETVLMDISEIWDYQSLLIATSLDTYNFVNNAITSGKKLFYVYDPNSLKQNDHENVVNINMEMVCRSQWHCDKLFQITGKKSNVINWDEIINNWGDK